MSAFRVFSLSQNKRSEAGHGSAATADLREDRRVCLQRLAQCIDVDPKTLIMEYDVFLPYAEQYYMSHSCPTREAWAAALKSLTRARPQAGHCLRVVLARYAAWISSSSSCERTFAKTQRLRGGQSEDGFFVSEEDVVQLQADPSRPACRRRFSTRHARSGPRTLAGPVPRVCGDLASIVG